ncbi:hypothetical protein Scep_003302 [Stephania cephalantha]|uniref:Ataxin-10 domain-containing protein n=1 Tax=Stephania cephalantha TaxID=152367 RepID=A0AAP0PUB0_9MAGN
MAKLPSPSSEEVSPDLEKLLELSRTVHGRASLASTNAMPALLKSVAKASNLQIQSSSLKLVRNLCAGEVSNQDSFIRNGGVEVVSDVLSDLGFDSDLGIGVVRMGLQVLGNVCLGGEDHRKAVWDRFFPDELLRISRIRRLEVVDPLCMVLWTCSDGMDERVAQICGSRGLGIVAEIVRTASEVGSQEHWLVMLFSKICFEESSFSQLFNELGSATAAADVMNNRDDYYSAPQSFLLSFLSERLSCKLDEISVSNEFALSVYGVLKKAYEIIDFSSQGKSGLPTGSPSIDVLGYSVTILRDVCAMEDQGRSKIEGSVNVVESLLSLGFLDFLLDVLRSLEPPEIIRKSMSQGENNAVRTYSDSWKLCPYKGFRRDIVAVIVNCLYRRKHVQDEIREKNGILLLMQQCVADEHNPFLREWGIWTMRNLLEGNEENQRVVAEMELQGSVEVPELTKLGLRVEVDQKNRRAKLVNIS